MMTAALEVSGTSERELSVRARNGDRQALEELIVRNMDQLSTMAARLVGAWQDLEDVVQETLLRATRSISSFRAESSFSTWLYSIMVNVVRDARRKLVRQGRSISFDDVPDEDIALVQGSSISPEDEALRQEECEAVRSAVMSLPKLDQCVIWLRESGQMSYQEISACLGCSVEAVKARLYRARMRIRSQMA